MDAPLLLDWSVHWDVRTRGHVGFTFPPVGGMGVRKGTLTKSLMEQTGQAWLCMRFCAIALPVSSPPLLPQLQEEFPCGFALLVLLFLPVGGIVISCLAKAICGNQMDGANSFCCSGYGMMACAGTVEVVLSTDASALYCFNMLFCRHRLAFRSGRLYLALDALLRGLQNTGMMLSFWQVPMVKLS